MSKQKAASEKAEESKTVEAAAVANAGQAATPANEVLYCIEVLPQPGGGLVKIGSMNCGAGAKGRLPKSKAEAAEAAGYVKITGIA